MHEFIVKLLISFWMCAHVTW